MTEPIAPAKRSTAVFLIFLFALAFLTGCGRKQPLSGKSYEIDGQRYHILASAKGFQEKGRASWYGRKFHGRKTASGETYNMYAMTAAHKTLPLSTWVNVRNLDNGREINVRINDRGPFVKGRVIDLSYTAAKKLGVVRAGTAPVVVTALGTASEGPDGRRVLKPIRNYKTGRFTIQVASFRDPRAARALAASLKRAYGRAEVTTYRGPDGVYYRVRTGEARGMDEAERYRRRLAKQGYRDCFIVAL